MRTKTLQSFIDYCEKNPNLRFWQALTSWSGYNFIYGSEFSVYEMESPILEDTFYIEDK